MMHRIFPLNPGLPSRLTPRLGWLVFSLVGSLVGTLPLKARGDDPLGLPPEAARKFLQTQCYECHVGDQAAAGLDLATLIEPTAEADSAAADSDMTDVWVRMFDRVRDGEMPPPEAAEPPMVEIDTFLNVTRGWLVGHQRSQAQKYGRVRGRRLTNLQLERTLHDLFGIDIPLADGFSAEPRVEGFVSVASGQAMSHFQLKQHLRAVDAALDEAFRRALGPEDDFYKEFSPEKIAQRKPKQRNREPELRDGLAVVWSSRLIFYGRMAVTTAPADGWYRFTIEASAVKSPPDHGVWCSVRSGPCVSSAPLLNTLGGFEATSQPGEWSFEGWLPKGHMLEVRPADANLKLAKFEGGQVGAGEGEPQDVPGVALHRVTMRRIHRGPTEDGVREALIGELAVGKTGSGQRQLLSDDPTGDAEALIRRFARRAFRRPVAEDEVAPYLAVARDAIAEGESLADALRAGYRAVLCSPRFLYFTENAGILDDHAIASRLSYFLWNRMPDPTLDGLADRGELKSVEAIRGQVRRMLEDPRGADFVKDFAAQWLDLCDIDFTEPDPRLYKDFDPLVQHAMLAESHLYLRKMLDENLGVSYLIDSDFTMLNSRLARFYGIEGVEGDAMRLVRLSPEDRRGGVLTHGSILKVTANGTTTSPVVRGVWVSERLLGQHIPPPPTNVPAIEPDIRGATTIREQLDKHKSNDSCAACHVKIDPPGFALESYDPSGKWRLAYAQVGGKKKLPVDPRNEMPDGTPFEDIADFKRLVLRHPDRLAAGLAEKLVTYATGATVRFADRQAIEHIVKRTSDSGHGFRSLVEAVAVSPLFVSK